MYKVEKLNYSEKKYKKILNNLRESLTHYFVETLQEDLKEANFWIEWIEKVIKSQSNGHRGFQVSSDEEVIGFIITIIIDESFALIRYLFILDSVNREEIAYILSKEAIERLKQNNNITKFNNASFTFPEDYLSIALKRLGFSILKRINMTLNLNHFELSYDLSSECSFAPFNKENLSEIAQLCVHSYKNHPDASFWEEVNSVPLYLEYLENSLKTYFLKDCSFVIKDEQEEIVGFCLAEEGNREDEFIIQNIVVNELNRGKGLGKALLSRVLKATATKGYKRAFLTVTEGNPAQQLYKSFGFKNYTLFNVIINT
ncbi:MAG: GNAT family N-acetyltransferase [Promethearchaeota archaeon]